MLKTKTCVLVHWKLNSCAPHRVVTKRRSAVRNDTDVVSSLNPSVFRAGRCTIRKFSNYDRLECDLMCTGLDFDALKSFLAKVENSSVITHGPCVRNLPLFRQHLKWFPLDLRHFGQINRRVRADFVKMFLMPKQPLAWCRAAFGLVFGVKNAVRAAPELTAAARGSCSLRTRFWPVATFFFRF